MNFMSHLPFIDDDSWVDDRKVDSERQTYIYIGITRHSWYPLKQAPVHGTTYKPVKQVT